MSTDQPLFESPVFTDADETVDEDVDLTDEDVTDEVGGANAPAGGRAQAVLEHVVTSIVDDPGAVRVTAERGRGGVVLSLRVAPADMGRVIGKRGRVAQAMRTLVRAAAAHDGADATVDILD